MKNLIRRVLNWKHWPFIPFYLPLSFVWLWYILRSRAIWFFSTSNPSLTFGGFEGESKEEMYKLLPEAIYPKSIYISPKKHFSKVCRDIQCHSFSYPFIVKPNVGMAGILFRKIDNEQQLQMYHQNVPVDYIIQDFVDYPLEIGIFYYRYPQHQSGNISAMFSKKFPVITGDGTATIKEILKKNNPLITEEVSKLDDEKLERILQKDEVFQLSFIGNRYHGTTFHDLSGLIDGQLLQLFDRISHDTRFYYGRYDIKCSSVRDLKRGENFSILEFNGAGSIPNHIYTGKYTLFSAYKEIINHWKALYEISRYNYRAGCTCWRFRKGLRYLVRAKKHFRILNQCDHRLVLSEKSSPVTL